MTPRREKLPWTRIAKPFAVADGLREATDSERSEAVAELLSEFRCQFKEAGREIDYYEKAREASIKKPKGDPAVITAALDALAPGSPIDPLLIQGLKNWAFRIFSQQNPIVALKVLLVAQHRRGKRAKNTERDFWIAVAVAEKMKSGMNLEDAAYAVAEGCDLEGDSIRKIYNRNHREAKAHVECSSLDSGSLSFAPRYAQARAVSNGDRLWLTDQFPHASKQMFSSAICSDANTCRLADATAGGRTPVLNACRELLARGFNPDAAVEIYRRDVLALRIRTLAAGARLTVEECSDGRPRFRQHRSWPSEGSSRITQSAGPIGEAAP